MNPGNTDSRSADELKAEFKKIAIRVDVLIERARSGAEIRSFKLFQMPDRPLRLLGLPDRREQFVRELQRCRMKAIEGEKGIERFYELAGQNPDNALGALRIAMKDARDLSARISGFETKVGGVRALPEALAAHKEKEIPKPAANVGPVVSPAPQISRGAITSMEIGFANRNDQHGEDSAREIINDAGDLRGLVVCDGVTNANGATASTFVADGLKDGFRQVKNIADLGAMRSQLDLLLNSVTKRLSEEARSKGIAETATTVLMAFASRRGFYIYYIGDGTIRQFTEDAYSVGDYLLTYEREGALEGYVSSNGVSSRPTFLFVDSRVTSGNFLVLATDGAELSDPNNHVTLGTMLRDDFVVKGKHLKQVLEGYLDTLPDRADDATVGVIWNRSSDA